MLVILLLFFQLHAGEAPLKKQLAVSIENSLKNKIYRNVDIGIQLSAIDGSQVLYRRNEKKPFIPASAIKIFISAISLSKFGAGF